MAKKLVDVLEGSNLGAIEGFFRDRFSGVMHSRDEFDIKAFERSLPCKLIKSLEIKGGYNYVKNVITVPIYDERFNTQEEILFKTIFSAMLSTYKLSPRTADDYTYISFNMYENFIASIATFMFYDYFNIPMRKEKYMFEEIIKARKSWAMQIKTHRKIYRAIRNEALKAFQIISNNYLDQCWLKSGIQLPEDVR